MEDMLMGVNLDFQGDSGIINVPFVQGLVLPVNGTDAANKAYVDQQSLNVRKLIGDINASLGVVPTSTKKGETWVVSVAGVISGQTFEAGDEIVARIDNATLITDFYTLQRNLDYATTTVAGTVRLAQSSDVATNGSATANTTEMVTPYLMALYIDNLNLEALVTKNSIVRDVDTQYHLSGDEAVPTDGKFYGKVAGNKGWFVPATLNHTHNIGDVIGLQTVLDSKLSSLPVHTHVIGDVTGLQTSLDGKALTGHTHIIADVTGLQTELNSKAALSHNHVIADITNLQTELNGKQAVSEKNAVNGYAGLGTDGRIVAEQMAQVFTVRQLSETVQNITIANNTLVTIDLSLGTYVKINITSTSPVNIAFSGTAGIAGQAMIVVTGNAQQINLATGYAQYDADGYEETDLIVPRTKTTKQRLIVDYDNNTYLIVPSNRL